MASNAAKRTKLCESDASEEFPPPGEDTYTHYNTSGTIEAENKDEREEPIEVEVDTNPDLDPAKPLSEPSVAAIPARRFYRPHPPDVQLRLQLLQHTSQLLKTRKRLADVFPRQELAFAFADAKPSARLKVFSFEKDSFTNGSRKYVVATYEQFWDVYKHLPPNERHFYEVIREGSPCALYFDVEFSRELNPDLNGPATASELIAFISDDLREQFRVDTAEANLVDLDSTTGSKFSRHLIFRNAVFCNNNDMGQYVKHLYYKAAKLVEQRPALARLFPFNSKGSRSFIVDQAVYTRNRNFRLYLSTKLAKRQPLVVTPRTVFEAKPAVEIFQSSLVCNVVSASPLHFMRHWNPVDHRTAIRVISAPIQSTSTAQNASGAPGVPPPSPEVARRSGHSTSVQPSPFPEVDQFVAEHVSHLPGSPGALGAWNYFPTRNMLVYTVLGNRFCENIGREHKSNHTMIAADLMNGVFYQKCYDPECKEFRGQFHQLPPDVAWPARSIHDEFS